MNDKGNAVGVFLADTAIAHQIQIIIKNSEMASYKLDQDMEALKHNFLTRGYFRKLEKENKKGRIYCHSFFFKCCAKIEKHG